MPNAQQSQAPSAWWQNAAVWILLALVTVVVIVVAVVVVIIWPDGSSGSRATTRAQPNRTAAAARVEYEAVGAGERARPLRARPHRRQREGTRTAANRRGLTGLLATFRSKFGDTMGFQLVVYPDYAITERVSPKNSHVEQDFMYRDGQWSGWGSDTTTSSF